MPRPIYFDLEGAKYVGKKGAQNYINQGGYGWLDMWIIRGDKKCVHNFVSESSCKATNWKIENKIEGWH
jgi:hypothetical protein